MAQANVRLTLQSIGVSVASVFLGLLIAGAIIAATGRDPWAAFVALLRGSIVGRGNIELTILNAIPLVFTGLSVAVAFRAGLFNIGAEGQVMVGGIAATAIGIHFAGGPLWTPLVALLGGAAAGAIWAFPAGWLRGRRGVHEVITTLMLSYIALHLTTFMRRYPLFDPKSTSQSSITVPSDARLPGLDVLFTGSKSWPPQHRNSYCDRSEHRQLVLPLSYDLGFRDPSRWQQRRGVSSGWDRRR